jgi:hypothetical protein
MEGRCREVKFLPEGSGAKFRKRLNEAPRPGIGSGGENSIPDCRRCVVIVAKFAEVEMTFPDPIYEFNAGDGD